MDKETNRDLIDHKRTNDDGFINSDKNDQRFRNLNQYRDENTLKINENIWDYNKSENKMKNIEKEKWEEEIVQTINNQVLSNNMMDINSNSIHKFSKGEIWYENDLSMYWNCDMTNMMESK